MASTSESTKDALVEERFIGRDPSCDVVINDPYVSPRHARLFRFRGMLFVEDMGSTNGVYVNERKIWGRPTCIQLGDKVRVGKTTVELC